MLKQFVLPYRIGFVQSHSYLSSEQVSTIKQVLQSNDEKILKAYERKLALLIGNGHGISFAAGRMAFYTIMKVLDIGPGDEVILTGFTCSVMPNAIIRIGAIPVFSDIDIGTFGSSAEEIEKKITPRTKMIVVQHSFGIPCNIRPIVEIGKKYNIFVLEDSAIALDSSAEGVKVGNWGDAAMFSTDHSKPLNTMIGGFLYTKNKSLYDQVLESSKSLPQLDKTHRERLFNQFLFERKYYTPTLYPRSILINYVRTAIKNYTSGNKTYTFLEGDYKRNVSSDQSYPYPAKMPSFLAKIGLFELERWSREKQKRKSLLKEYLNVTSQSDFNGYLPKAYFDKDFDIVPLRFVFTHPNSEKLMKKIAKFVDVDWTWFRNPIVCCPDGPESLGYRSGSCPVSERIGKEIVNWPCVIPEKWNSKTLEIFQKIINDSSLK